MSAFLLLSHPFIQKLKFLFNSKKWEARFVGGIVRDHYKGALGIDILKYDIDLAINQPIEDVMAFLNTYFHVIPTGLKHGTITVYDPNSGLKTEITQLRSDINPDGRHSDVVFTSSFLEDAKRRDFTINSIYLDMEGNLFDPFKGLDDLKNQVVKFIGAPKDRLLEDHLRILRYFRFLGYFEKPLINNGDLDILKDHFPLLKNLSKERITQELLKLINYPNADRSLHYMNDLGLFSFINLSPLIDPKYFNIPECIKHHPEITFALLSDSITLKKKLRLPNALLKRIHFIQTMDCLKEAYYKFGFDFALMLAWYKNAKNETEDFEKEKKYLEILHDQHPSPTLPVKASDLIEQFNLQGPSIGITLKKVEKWWIDNDFLPNKQMCLEWIEHC